MMATTLSLRGADLEPVYGWLEQHGDVLVEVWGLENSRRAALLAYSDGPPDGFSWSNWVSTAYQDPRRGHDAVPGFGDRTCRRCRCGVAEERFPRPGRRGAALAAVTATMATILAIHAHPDDIETLGAGTLALLARLGHRISIVTATAGEGGATQTTSEQTA